MASVSDIRLEVSWRDHPKRKKLRRRVGADGVLALLDLWLWTAQNRPDGVLTGLTAEDVEIAAQWQGTPGALVAALLDDAIRLIEQDEVGTLRIHGWDEHQRWASGAARRSEAGRIAAEKKWAKKLGASDPGNARRIATAPNPDAAAMRPQAGEPATVARSDAPIPIPIPIPNPVSSASAAPTPSPTDSPTGEEPPFDLTSPPTRTARKRSKPERDPLPFRIADAFAALADSSKGRVALEDFDYRLAGPVGAVIRQIPDLDAWKLAGEYLGAGGLHYLDEPIGPLWVAKTGNMADLVAKARSWAKAGKPDLSRRRQANAKPPAARDDGIPSAEETDNLIARRQAEAESAIPCPPELRAQINQQLARLSAKKAPA